MKAVVYTQAGLPIQDPHSLFETDLPKPTPGTRDLLIAVKAIAVIESKSSGLTAQVQRTSIAV